MNDQPKRSFLVGFQWEEIAPWLLLSRAFSVAASPSMILTGALGALLSACVWQVLLPYAGTGPSGSPEAARVVVAAWPWETYEALRVTAPQWREARAVFEPACGWWELYGAHPTFRSFMVIGSGSLLSLLVWALCGGILTRKAVVRLGRDERLGLAEVVRFVMKRIGAYFAAPLFPQIGVALLIAGAALAGLFMRSDILAVLVAVGWPVVLVLALVATIVVFGLAIAWPLMWVTISAERDGDVFEATQRAYSYAWNRPWRYGFYVLVAAGLGIVSWIVAWCFTELLEYLAWWGVRFGVGEARLETLKNSATGMAGFAGIVLAFWMAGVKTLAVGFLHAFFWSAFSGIYLLMRYDVDDHVPFDQVYVPDEREQYVLPPLAVVEEDGAASDQEGGTSGAGGDETGEGPAVPAESVGADASSAESVSVERKPEVEDRSPGSGSSAEE